MTPLIAQTPVTPAVEDVILEPILGDLSTIYLHSPKIFRVRARLPDAFLAPIRLELEYTATAGNNRTAFFLDPAILFVGDNIPCLDIFTGIDKSLTVRQERTGLETKGFKSYIFILIHLRIILI